MTAPIPAALRRSLRDTFGFDELRSGQHGAILSELLGNERHSSAPRGGAGS